MAEVLEVLRTASTSLSMSAQGFDMKFSALELLDTLENLCISQTNLSTIAKADVLPTLVSMLVTGIVPIQRVACRILWILLGESNFHFNKEVFAPLFQEILTMLLENQDTSLQVFSQLLLSEPRIRTNGNHLQFQTLSSNIMSFFLSMHRSITR